MANQYTPFRYISETHKECSWCNQIKLHSEFHKDKTNQRCLGLSYYCKECANEKSKIWNDEKGNPQKRNKQAVEKKYKRKQEAIVYFENKCMDCNNSFPSCCYDFHHLDPKEKELNLANAANYSKEIYMKELKKCVMLCSNCHRIRHSL